MLLHSRLTLHEIADNSPNEFFSFSYKLLYITKYFLYGLVVIVGANPLCFAALRTVSRSLRSLELPVEEFN